MLSGMHPIGEILNYDDKREFQQKGPEHMHVGIHIKDAPRIDEDDDAKVIAFIDKYITCSIPDEKEYPELNRLVKKVQIHRHTMTCKKKKGVRCRFNAPWPPSEETQIIRGKEFSKSEQKACKEVLDKVLGEVIGIDDHEATLAKVLDSCGVSEDEYSHALEVMAKKITIIYLTYWNKSIFITFLVEL